MITNIGINFAGGGGGADAKLESKDYNLTANGSTAIQPSEGYDGISGGTIQVNVDMQPAYNSGYTEGYTSGYTSGSTDGYATGYTEGYASGYTSGETVGYASGETVGYSSGTTDGMAAQKALLTSTAITENGSYTSENGFSAVTVDVQGSGGNRFNDYLKGDVTAITQSDLSGVTTIRSYIFNKQNQIKSIDLPANVKELGDSSLDSTAIYTIDLSNVTSLGQSVFNACGNLTGVTGFDKYEGSLKYGLFRSCGQLIEVTTGASAVTDNYVFDGCSNLTSITFVNNVNQIVGSSNYRTFNGCPKMEFLDFRNNYMVPTLGNKNAFSAFTANYEIRVPDVLYDTWTGATNWSDSAVVGHIVPCASTLTYGGFRYHTTGNTEITISAITGYTFTSSTFDSTSGWGENKYWGLRTIPKNCFRFSSSLTDVIIEEGIKRVEDSSFSYCDALTAVTFPSTIEIIDGHWKLFGSGNFNTMTINAVTPPTLGPLAFKDGNFAANGTLYVPSESIIAYQTWLTQDAAYDIRNWTVTAIPPYADCQITTTAASETVKIGYTYNDLAALADVLVDGVSVKSSLVDDTYTFADAGTHIVRYVYTSSTATNVTRQVDRLESYSASTGVKAIGQNALNMYQAANASQLESIYLPGVTNIGSQGITNVPAADIYAPNVTVLGVKALQFNPNLDPVSLSLDKVYYIGNNALRQTAIKSAHLGTTNLTTYEYNVFNECYSLSSLTFDSATTGLTTMPSVGDKTYDLTEIVFPDCVQVYGQGSSSYAMMTDSSGLTSITFGTGTTLMDGLIFKGDMGSLTSIYCKATTAPTISSGCFGPVTANTGTLYVPAGSDYSTWATELGSNWTVSDTL